MRSSFIKRVTSWGHYGPVTAVSRGLFTVVALICLCGLGLSRFDMSEGAVFAAVSFSLAMGGYITGYSCGRYKRRKGIIWGLKSGAVLLIITCIFGILYMRSFSLWVMLRQGVLILLPSAVGGIIGANKKNYCAPKG